jgi:hypothetical protein
VLLETRVTSLNKALTGGATTQNVFTGALPSALAPDIAFDINQNETKADGFVDNNPPGLAGFNRLFVMPYASGANATFSIRVYGWNQLGNDPTTLSWLPTFLCEVLCTTCTTSGVASASPSQPQYRRTLPDTEFLCDTLSLTAGGLLHAGLGLYGDLISYPGSLIPCHFLVDVRGCQKISFDFQQTDPVAMNAVWCTI